MEQGFNFFEQAELQAEQFVTTEHFAVNSDDFREDNGHDYSKTFLEADFGESWELRLLTKPNSEVKPESKSSNITSRVVRKRLPDLTRAGKNFWYISSNNANTCEALQLFFDLAKLKKEGDTLAEAKITEFMGSSQEGCVYVQVLEAPEGKKDMIGKVMLLTFPNGGGDTAHVANLIDIKLNPKSKRETKVNVFDMMFAPILFLNCEKKQFNGKDGRTFASSSFSADKVSPLIYVDGEWINFEKEDVIWEERIVKDKDGKDIKLEIPKGFKDPKYQEAFFNLLKDMENPDISVHNHFDYKAPNDPRNTEETNKHITEVFAKMKNAVALIRNAKSIDEIKAVWGTDSSATAGANGEVIGTESAKDLLADSALDALDTSTLGSNSGTVTANETVKTGTVTDALDINSLMEEMK